MLAAMFAAWFRQRLAALGLSYAAFGRLVHLSKPAIAAVAAGRRGPPLDRLPRWLDALQLTSPDDRDQAELLAALAHVPAPIAARVVAMAEELQALRADLAAIRAVLPASVRRAARPPLRALPPPRPGGGRGPG